MRRPGWDCAARVLICAALGTPAASAAPAGQKAPAIQSERWINSRPLSPRDLVGKVVLVEFWTFDCINCIRTVPAMRRLRAAFADSDVAIVGVHTPELDVERDPKNVERAVARLGLKYPVALDNDFAIWRAFHNRYWPALYVVDRRGMIRHVHTGELHQGTPDWREVVGLIEALRREPA